MTSDKDRIWMDQWLFIQKKTCGSKIRHKTRKEAKAHRAKKEAEGDTNLDVYRCQFCGFFHVGHNRERK